MEVSNGLAPARLEAVYQEALEIELSLREIPHQPQRPLLLYYKGRRLKKEYVADFVCYDAVIVEIKDQSTGQVNGEGRSAADQLLKSNPYAGRRADKLRECQQT